MIVIAIIVYATWFPHPLPDESLPMIPHIDKLIHAIMFGGLAGAIMFDYYRKSPEDNKLTPRVVFRLCICVVAFAVVDEVMQGILDIGRPSDVLDLLADWGGIVVAAFTAPPAIRAIFKNRSVIK